MKRNKFSLSYYNLFSCDMGELVPIGLTEVLPGDSFQHSTSLLVRVSPLLAPVMHPVHIKVHHWFVPHRLVWSDWEKFITGGEDGMDASSPPTIALTATNSVPGSLADYLGLPVVTGAVTQNVSAIPFRGYSLIYNEWYRDQDLQPALNIPTSGGVDGGTSRTLQKVNWEKDYFTSARPWTQKGPEVQIPLTGNAPVKGFGKTTGNFTQSNVSVRETGGTTTVYPIAQSDQPNAADATMTMRGTAATNGYPDIYADLNSVSGVDINDLRLALALQRYEEARARYGSRYTEYLRYLGVRSSDARLQRPEYLGGGKQTIQFSEVLQTAPTTSGSDTVGVGNLKGHGIGAVRSNRYRRFFEEHGYIFTLVNVKPRTMYTQGIPKTWLRRTKEDYHQRELEHVGQQEVHNLELYAMHSNAAGIFGYQDRYDDYRRAESRVSGEFKTTQLDYWHMARTFAADPVLNSSFVTSVPTKRINAVQTNDVLWVMAQHSIQVRRMLSKTGTSFIL